MRLLKYCILELQVEEELAPLDTEIYISLMKGNNLGIIFFTENKLHCQTLSVRSVKSHAILRKTNKQKIPE